MREAARRLYRTALRLLPRRLRSKHGAAMEALFLRELDRARARGRLAGAATAAWAVLDVLRRAAYERLRADAPSTDPPPTHASAMEGFTQDLRHALRSLRSSPAFTASAVLILALAVGVNTAIFSVVKGVLLEPLPFPESHRVVHVGMDYGGGPVQSLPHYRYDWLSRGTDAFAATATWRGFRSRIVVEGRPRPVEGLRVDRGFLETLGWSPVRGRAFAAVETVPGGPEVAMVSRSFAARHLGGGDPVGGTVELGGTRHTVVGVLPEAFAFPQSSLDVEVLLPLRVEPDPRDEGQNYAMMARLAPGVDREAAQEDLDAAWAAFREAHPDLVGDPERGPVLADFDELYVGGPGGALRLILGAVALVLLIACVNVANLLLARSVRRRREVGIRAALGATRGRVVRLLVTESLALSLLGGAVGVLLGRALLDGLLALAPVRLPRMETVTLDAGVMAAAFGVMAMVGLFFGLVMAIPGTGGEGLAGTLRKGGRGSSAPGRMRRGMLLVQSAVAMVLLVGAGLLLGTLAELRSVDAGFDPTGVVAASFPLSPEGYDDGAALARLHRSVRDELAARGIRETAQALNLPLERGLNIPVAVAGRPEAFEGAVEYRGVSEGYFDLLGIEIRRGRALGPSDGADAPLVVVVSRSFADRYFPDGEVLGRRLEIGRYRGRWIHPALEGFTPEIIGVAEDVRDRSLRSEPSRTVYLPVAQTPGLFLGSPVFLFETPGPGGVTERVREGMAAADPALPEPEIRPMDRVVTESLAEERFNAFLLTAFAVLALALTAFGVFGVIAYDVRQRRREIGIRMALGARPGAVLRLMAAQGLLPVLGGLVLGAGAAVWLTRLIRSLVWGVSPTDPAVFAAVAAVLVAVTGVASWLPARQAARVDPVRSLGAE